ncbi:MAG: hypothetical protein GXP48_05750 [Acidobacteria bacterium]|nr:hypothetical protein [Acidobacteriota bacterium]
MRVLVTFYGAPAAEFHRPPGHEGMKTDGGNGQTLVRGVSRAVAALRQAECDGASPDSATVRCGVAFNEPSITWSMDLLILVDQRLYGAKNEGRGRVVFQ